jgi:beta-lactamase class A
MKNSIKHMTSIPQAKLSRFIFPLCLLLLTLATSAAAAPAKQYALAYTWNQEIQRALDDRSKLARTLSPPANRQLLVVGRNGAYGVIYPMRGSLGQARQLAVKQSQALTSAGFAPADILPEGTYSSLYHLQLALGSSSKALQADYQRVSARLQPDERARLQIEQIGARSYALVFRCWADKAEAVRIARQQRPRLQGKQSPTLIAAIERPGLVAASNPAGIAADPPLSKQAKSRRLAVLPANKDNQSGSDLKTSKSRAAGINSKLQMFLKEQRAKGRLQQRDMAAMVAFDLTNNTYLASLNAQRSFQAASMIKPFVALAFFDQVERGKLKYTSTHRQMMEEMIQHSDNEATNWFIRQVGGPARCNAVINGQYGRLLSKVRILEYIPPGGKTYKNSALPQDYVQFLRALWNNQLPRSQEMLRVMSLPGRDRIFCGTEVPPGTQVYNKTGTTSYLCGDMGILVTHSKNGQKVPYAVVGIVERPTAAKDYKRWMETGGGVIRDFSSLVYEEMKHNYNLL